MFFDTQRNCKSWCSDLLDPTSHCKSWCSDLLDPTTCVTSVSCWIQQRIYSEVDELIRKSLVLFFGQNPNSKNLYRLSEEERYDNLIKIFGIGKWSIEMFEMFYIRNKNIFSSGDAAIRVAMEELKMVKKTSNFGRYDKYAKKWDPYKTIACLHLWHFIES